MKFPRGDVLTPPGTTTPISAHHPAVGQKCAACPKTFKKGDVLCAVVIRNKANVTLDNAHEACVQYEEEAS